MRIGSRSTAEVFGCNAHVCRSYCSRSSSLSPHRRKKRSAPLPINSSAARKWTEALEVGFCQGDRGENGSGPVAPTMCQSTFANSMILFTLLTPSYTAKSLKTSGRTRGLGTSGPASSHPDSQGGKKGSIQSLSTARLSRHRVLNLDETDTNSLVREYRVVTNPSLSPLRERYRHFSRYMTKTTN